MGRGSGCAGALDGGGQLGQPRGGGVIAELVVGTEAQAALELRVAIGAALAENFVERAFQAARGGAFVGPPVAEPDRPRVLAVDRRAEELGFSITAMHGADTAMAYAAAQEAGIAQIRAFVDEGIDCDFRRRSAYVYSSDRSEIEDEADAVRAWLFGVATNLLRGHVRAEAMPPQR